MVTRIISVTMTAGRCGSSLLMQILEASGCCAGPVSKVTGPNNRDGYYEILELQDFLYNRIFPELKGFMPEPVSELPWRHKDIEEFETLFFDKWFKDCDGPAIVKAPYVFPANVYKAIAESRGIPFASIACHRDVGAMALSAMKMNSEKRDYWQWVEWFKDWKAILAHTESVPVVFETWFTDPHPSYRTLFRIMGLPNRIGESELMKIIKPQYRHL